MKLRLPHRLQAALVAALASVSFTTLSSGTLSAAFFFGSQAFAEEAADNTGATIDLGDTNLDAQAAIDEEEGKGEAKEPGSAPINQAGFNGIRGSSDDFDRQSTAAAATESSIDTENVGTADQANYTGTSADLPSNDLGFTSNSYASGSSNGSVVDSPVTSFTQATAVPAVQQVQYVESTAPTTSSGTTTTGAATGGYSATPVFGATGGGSGYSLSAPAMPRAAVVTVPDASDATDPAAEAAKTDSGSADSIPADELGSTTPSISVGGASLVRATYSAPAPAMQGAAGEATGTWTYTTDTGQEEVLTNADYNKNGWQYDAATGMITGPEGAWSNFTFVLNNTALKGNTAQTRLLYVKSYNGTTYKNEWGFTAGTNSSTATGLGAVWTGNMDWGNNNSFTKSQNDVDGWDTDGDGKITLTAKINGTGTTLWAGTAASGTALMDKGGLKDSANTIKSLTLNTDFIESFTARYTTADVTREDGSVHHYSAPLIQESGRHDAIKTSVGYDAYIVKSGAEMWFASGGTTVEIAGDIYVNGKYSDGYGALRLGTQTNGVLKLNGGIYLGGNSEFSADAEGDNNRGTIQFNGEVVGEGYALKLTTPRNAGSNVLFNGAVTLGSFETAASVEFGANSVASLGTVTFTTANRTFTNNGSITVSDGTMNSIAGNGILTKTGAGTLTINSAGTSGGTVNVNEGTLAIGGGTATLQSLKVADTATLRLGNGASVVMNIGSSGARKGVTLGNLELTGASATLNTGTAWNDTFSIASLKSADGGSTLNLRSAATVTVATVFNLNGSASSSFSGTVDLGLTAGTGAARKLALNINENAGSALSDSVVNFGGNNSGNYSLGLGIHAESVTVKGITTGNNVADTHRYIFAGAAASDATDFANISDGETQHTLIINTGSSSVTAYSTDAKVGAGLNIEKAGQGTQAFSGDMSAFRGNITVSGGTLALGSAVTGAKAVSVNGGTLDLGAALTTTGNLSVANGATLKFAGANQLTVGGDLTLAGTLDVSRINYSEGATVTLGSYTGTANITGYTLSGLGGHEATLNAASGALTLTFNDTPVPPGPEFGTNLGNVMYVGDSITHGVNSGSYRWSLFQILRDAGIAHNDCGPLTGNWSGGVAVGTLYGGESFSNKRTAIFGAHAYEISDTAPKNCPTSRNDTVWNTANAGEIYANTSINNWLGLSNTKRFGGAYEGEVYDVDTFLMLIGTNDILTDAAGDIKNSYETAMPGVLSKLLGATQTGEHSFTFESDAANTSSVVTIWKSMMESNSDAKVVFMSVPTLGAQHANASNENIMKAVHVYNEALEQWCTAHGVRYVQSDTGIVDVSNSLGAGVSSMFQSQSDGTHPSFQGDLIFAGNIAKAMGYAGRTIGLARSASTGAGWTPADSTSITIASGTSQTVAKAEGAFSELFGYTIDFGATYGNGAEGGWSASSNALTIQIGDGSHTGTLKVSEAYIMWGDSILYSRDNHLGGDNLRIAYVNNSLSSSDNVTAGYYVWLGDQLIGEKLEATDGSLNGITLSSSGASGIISNLSWSDTAYAPLSNGFVNPDDAALFHLVQVSPNPNHDNLVSKSLEIVFTHATENGNQFGTSGKAATGDLLLKRTGGAEGNAWFGPVGAAHTEGGVSILYSGVDATSCVVGGVKIGSNIFGAINGGVTNGNVSVVLDNGTHLGYGTYDGTGNCSIIGTYQQSIGGDFRVEINNATLDGGIIMGVGNGSGKSIANTLLYINGGATVGGDVFGGNYSKNSNNTITGKADIYITGGTVNGSVYGGNKLNGTIVGNTNITITGGIITGDVNGGGTGGTITGKTNVTIEGNLPSIGGSISADYVTLKGVALNTDGYTDGFDYYNGTITGTEKITLNNYTVADMRASLVTQTLEATGSTSTTIHNLTLTACTITANEGTSVTLADNLTLGNTATFSGAVSLANNLTIDASAMTQGSQADRITLFSGTEGSSLGVNDLSTISVTGSGAENYHLTLGDSGRYLYMDRNFTVIIPWADPSEDKIKYSGVGLTADSGLYVAGAHVDEIEEHTGTGVYTSVTGGTNVGPLYANSGQHTGDVYMLVKGVTMSGSSAYGWIAAHNSGTLTGSASVKVENSGSSKAVLFGAVKTKYDAATTVDGNVYVEVDDGTFATYTTSGAMASYAGSYQADITGEARLVTTGGTFEYDVYGGVHDGNNSIGSTTLDLRGGTFNANVYGGGRTGSVTGDTNVTISGTAVVNDSVYGGGNGGTVGGSTNVTISGNDAQVLGNVYGNTAATQGGTVTIQDRTNGFGSNTGDILTETLNIQNTQGTVASEITAETVHLTGNSTATINSLTLTPTSAADTCALTMETGSALTLGGTLSLSKAANYSGSLALTDGMTLDLSRMNLSGMEEPVTLLNSSSGNLSYTHLNTIQIYAPSATYEGYNLSVDTNNNLVLTFVQPTNGLIWDGSVNDRWSNQITDTNWHKVDDTPGSDYFTAKSNVVFEQGESATIVDISDNISAGTVSLRSGADVTLHTDPQVARTLNVDRLSVASGADLMLVANVDMTIASMVGAGTVTVENSASLHLTDGVVNTGTTLVVNGGGVLELAGTGDDFLLAVQNMKLGKGAVVDVSNIQFTGDQTRVMIVDIDGRLDFPSRGPGDSESTSHLIDTVGVVNYQGGLTDVVHLVYERGARKQASDGTWYFENAQLYLQKEKSGLYWNNRDVQGHLTDGVWDASYTYTTDKGTVEHTVDGTENWNSERNGETSGNVATELQKPLYFITDDEQQAITISVVSTEDSQQPQGGAPMQASTIVIGGGGTFNFVRATGGNHFVRLDPNQASSLIVREGTTAHFEMAVEAGEFGDIHVESDARLDVFDAVVGETGVRFAYNQGLMNLSNTGYISLQVVVNEGETHIGRVWDDQGHLVVEPLEPDIPTTIMLESLINKAGAEMTLAADTIERLMQGDLAIEPHILNEGTLTFCSDDAAYMALYDYIPVEGMGIVQTVGENPVYFTGQFVDPPATVDGSMLNAGAKETVFNGRVTITDTTTLTAADFAEDEDKRSTTTFKASSQLGEHVVMGANTTLDLNTTTGTNPVYTLGEVHSATAGTDQNLIVRSGVTANVDGNVSLPDGKAQVAGGGKLTIGGASSTVGELAATGGGTALVELNGSNANEAPVLNAKKLSNENGTTLRVLNTDTENARTAQFNIGDKASASSSNYSGALQYGIGAYAASGSGMELTIKDNNVAAGAVLEAYYDADAPQSAPVNVVVDTDAAKVVGLSDNISGPDADRSMSVSGSGKNTAETGNNGLEITGNDDYEYAGTLGAKLDIAYTGDGSQTIQGGVSNFNGAVTVDNGTTEEGVLAILNASSVSITDLTIGANDKLNVKQYVQGSQADGMTTVTGTLTARGGSGNASKLDGNLIMDDGSTFDVSAAGGQGGLNLTGTLTINDGAQLSTADLAGVKDLGWFEMYDLAFGVTDMSSFGQVDWSEGVDVTEVFAGTGLNAEEYYVRYSQTEAGGNVSKVGAVYIYRIPEPATSTLSLLALAALAARRRRK